LHQFDLLVHNKANLDDLLGEIYVFKCAFVAKLGYLRTEVARVSVEIDLIQLPELKVVLAIANHQGSLLVAYIDNSEQVKAFLDDKVIIHSYGYELTLACDDLFESDIPHIAIPAQQEVHPRVSLGCFLRGNTDILKDLQGALLRGLRIWLVTV
jgi:hypothetical protein